MGRRNSAGAGDGGAAVMGMVGCGFGLERPLRSAASEAPFWKDPISALRKPAGIRKPSIDAPADGATLESAPDRITLRFNGPVQVISLRLVDESGQATPLVVSRRWWKLEEAA
jgi:CopC domain